MKWIDFVRESRGSEAIIYLVGNKNDLGEQRNAASVEIAKTIANQQGIKYHEVSAKTADGINELFTEITARLLHAPVEESPTSTVIPQKGPKFEPALIATRKPE